MWKDIKNYEGLYQINEKGEVKALAFEYVKKDGKKDCRKEHLMKLKEQPNGYIMVGLRKLNENAKYFYVHRLVAETFIPNPENLPQVNHKDENTKNNKADNLEWCDGNYNLNYGTRKDKYFKSVDCIDDSGNVVKHYNSIIEAEKDGFKTPSIIRSCKIGYKHYGYRFKYAS